MSPKKSLTQDKRKRYNDKEKHVFFDRVQEKRLALDMDQKYFAYKLGITPSAVSRMEAGVLPNDPERLVKIADILHVSLDWLFGREP